MQFYYGWKKTRDATRPKPLARQRNTTTATHRKPKGNQLKVNRSILFDIFSLSILLSNLSLDKYLAQKISSNFRHLVLAVPI